jgi:limonene-1,2-epoxide hydrolase
VDDANAVERYVEALADRDWDALAATLVEEGLVRDGPFCDVIEGKAAYVEFLRTTIAALAGYRLEVQRVSHASAQLSFVELTETVDLDGVPTTYPECIVYERDRAGRIRRVSVYLKTPPA